MSVFYFDPGAGGPDPASLVTFFTAIRSLFPSGTTITVPSSGDDLDEATGDLAGAWTASGGGSVSGNGAGTYAKGVGLRTVWNTAGIFGGRRVRGSTFICPIVSGCYEADGTIQAGFLTTVDAAANAYAAAANGAVIWSRPSADNPTGEMNAITSATVPDRISWLRSRRT